ncbi:hypothetical protein VQ042_18930 [Aurantimonas sp. A2-1-M11]|uniref:hypothetical protein n=1 Tax=Aurantimonas sp. A2-1-M11 TaxID=3113712 RepID=UPI002F959DEE
MTSFLGKMIVLAATAMGLKRLVQRDSGDSSRAGEPSPRGHAAADPAPSSPSTDAATTESAALAPAASSPEAAPDATEPMPERKPEVSDDAPSAPAPAASDSSAKAPPRPAPRPAEDPLEAKHRAAPFERNFRSVDYSRLSLDEAAITADRERQRRMHSTWSPPPPERRKPAEPSQGGVFSSFGGSVIAAEVIRGGDTGRVPDPMPPLPGGAVPLAGPHPDAPTPDAAEREGRPADPLAVKHRAEPFDQDFRTVDYANLDDDGSEPSRPHDSAADDSAMPPVMSPAPAGEAGYPAAFRTASAAAPLKGAQAAPDDGGNAAENPGDRGPGAAVLDGDEPANAGKSEVSPAATAREPDAAPDDLTRIKGIGPAVERLLFEQGIFRFHQIAALGDTEIAAIERAIGFKGRIGREGWVEQARALDEQRASD